MYIYIYIYVLYIYICIHSYRRDTVISHTYEERQSYPVIRDQALPWYGCNPVGNRVRTWGRALVTDQEVNTNGAATKDVNCAGLDNKICPGIFWRTH